MHAMVEVHALPRSTERVGFLRDAGSGLAWFRRSSSAHLICHVPNRASRSVRSETHVGVLPTQDYLDYFAYARREAGQKSGK